MTKKTTTPPLTRYLIDIYNNIVIGTVYALITADRKSFGGWMFSNKNTGAYDS